MPGNVRERNWRDTFDTAASFGRAPVRTKTSWSAAGQPTSSHRPSGDHVSERNAAGPSKTRVQPDPFMVRHTVLRPFRPDSRHANAKSWLPGRNVAAVTPSPNLATDST